MNIGGIEAFIVVAQTRNMTRASAILNQAQSTISKRIKQLEEEVGTVLFERSKGARSIHLTTAGEAFMAIGERWLALEKEVALLGRKEQALSISIGALDTHGPLLKRCFALLAEHNPQVNVRAYSLHSDAMYEALENRKIDIGFSTIDAAHSSIIVEPYFSEPMLGVCRGTSRLASRQIVEVPELDQRHEVFVPWSVAYSLWHDKYFDPRQHSRITLFFTSILADMLTSDESWLIVPASYARLGFDRERFAIFRISPEPPDRACFKLTRRNSRLPVQQCIAIVESYLRPIIQEEFGPNRDGRSFPI